VKPQGQVRVSGVQPAFEAFERKLKRRVERRRSGRYKPPLAGDADDPADENERNFPLAFRRPDR
jgi:hypothetical protein